MLKKLVTIGSLLAIGPMLAGCPNAAFLAIHTVPLVIDAASEIASSTNLNRRSGYPEEARRSAAKEDRKFSRLSRGNSYSDFSHYDDVSLCSAIVSANDNYLDDRLAELNARGGIRRCSITMKNLIIEKIEKRQIASSTNLNRRSGYPEEARRSAAKEDRKFARSSGAARSNQNASVSSSYLANISKSELCRIAKYGRTYKEKVKQILRSKGLNCGQAVKGPESYSGYLANISKSELCHLAKYGGAYKEKAKQILRSKGLNCDYEQQRLAEAQRARQAAIEKKKRDDAQRQAKAKREAEERRRAEAKRKADAAKKAKLYRVGSGSGFSISRDGLIVTNHHVIDGCSAVAISDKGDLHRAVVQSIDERNDLALLKSKLKPRHVFALNPNGTDILREIYVAGYPFGRMVSNSVKVTKGIVSSLVGLENNSSQIQIDAPIQTGNSGGPILDNKGRVVGVSVSKLDTFEIMKKRKQIPEGIGFGVKSETLIQMLKSSGVRTYKKGGLKTTDEIAKAIRGGTFYISCLMTAERYKRLKGKKVMFEGVDLD